MNSALKKYKIIVAYDGTDYAGWQIQKELPNTVAGTLERKFKEVFGSSIHLYAASRTDAGVHACGQVASFTTDLKIPIKRMIFAWNNVLPDSISIRSLQEVSLDFYPRAKVQEKIYFYHFFINRPLPFVARYGTYFYKPIDLVKLKKCLKVFIGTHDFKAFSSDEERENTVRTINALYLESFGKYKLYRIVVKGPGFLRYMIRRIVGACIAVASNDVLGCDDLKRILESKNPEHTLANASAKGLMLYKIRYEDEKKVD